MPKILITGARGQIGSVLLKVLSAKHGESNVIGSDIKEMEGSNPFELLDITDINRLREVVATYQIDEVYHLAAILSAKGEIDPLWTWDLNMQGLFNILEVAKEADIKKIFYPSSIAVFGNQSKLLNTPQHSIQSPTTVYGISKVAGENWAQYYHLKYGIDVRSVRFPGLVGHDSFAGGGTTDYAVDIFHAAIKNEKFSCFLGQDTYLPMMFMDDAIRAIMELMEAPEDSIRIRTSYNLAGMSFSPAEIFAEIKKHKPGFEIEYKPDHRQAIADSWPDSIDDTEAMVHWGWKAKHNLESMVEIMLEKLAVKYATAPLTS